MVKIVEFSELNQDGFDALPFDVVDDMSVYMRNDPLFYRKQFFPVVLKMKNSINKKEKLDPHEVLGPIVDSAAESYCKKYNIGRRPETLLNKDERDSLIQKLFSEELNNIKLGEY